MESNNILFFVFIFLINTKILLFSKNFGYISLTYEGSLNINDNFKEENVEIKFEDSTCNISFKGDFKYFDYFFEKALSWAPYIKTIDLSNLRITPKTMKGMFYRCNSLEEIKGLSELNTSEVSDMSYMFGGCTRLEKLNL